MNTSGIQNQSQNANMSSFKTNQNLDRLSKISERLANIHLNIENDKYSKYEEVEVRIANLDEKAIETNEVNFKTFAQIKDQITSIIQSIEEDRTKFESSYESRTKYISTLEFNLMKRFETESAERKEMEKRLYGQIDDRFNILKNELYKEEKNRTESVENFKFYLETEVPKIVEQMKNEQGDREEGDEMLNKMIDEKFAKLADVLSSEKKAREETEEAFLDMLRSIINKIKAELENEKKQRESNKKMKEICPFTPHIPQKVRNLVKNRKETPSEFIARMAKNKNENQEIKISKKSNKPRDPKTGKPLFRPNISRGPKDASQREVSVNLDSYYDKKLLQDKNEAHSSEIYNTLEKKKLFLERSMEIIMKMKFERYKEIFNLLDSDQDGLISYNRIKLSSLDQDLLQAMTPLLEDLQASKDNMTFKQFCIKVDRLLSVKIFSD